MAPDEAVPENAAEFPEVVLPEAVLVRLEALGESLNDISRRLAKVAEASRNTRRLTIGLGISLVLDVLLTVTVTLLSLSALNQGSVLHQSQLAACNLSNQSRVENKALWGYLFQLSGGVKTSQERLLLNYVNKTFAPENCTKLYP